MVRQLALFRVNMGALYQSSYQRNYHPMNQHQKSALICKPCKVTCEVCGNSHINGSADSVLNQTAARQGVLSFAVHFWYLLYVEETVSCQGRIKASSTESFRAHVAEAYHRYVMATNRYKLSAVHVVQECTRWCFLNLTRHSHSRKPRMDIAWNAIGDPGRTKKLTMPQHKGRTSLNRTK